MAALGTLVRERPVASCGWLPGEERREHQSDLEKNRMENLIKRLLRTLAENRCGNKLNDFAH